MNTLTGASYRATSEIVSSCDRSPHSAAKSTRNDASTGAQAGDVLGLLGVLLAAVLLVAAALADQDHRADQEHHQRDAP